MLIEFTGPTGAGKSTLSCQFADLLKDQGVKYLFIHSGYMQAVDNDVPDYIADLNKHGLKTDLFFMPWFLLFVLRHSGFAWHCLKHIAKAPTHKSAQFRAFLRKAGMFSFFSRRKYKNIPILIDEGLCQSLHNIFVHPDEAPDERDIRAFVNNLPLVDNIVLVNAMPDVLVKNLQKRGDLSPRIKHEHQLDRFTKHAVLAYEWFSENPRVKERLIPADQFDQWSRNLVKTIRKF